MQSAPLARRTAQGVLVDERLVRVACRWTDLASRDGERVEVEWTAQAGCVDTPADRQMLAERLLGANDATLDVAAVARLLVDEVRPTLARLVATSDATTLLDGSRDTELIAAIETAARRAGFAAGLRVAGPFTIGLDSPSVRRARDAERARVQLDALSADRATRSADSAALADAIARGGDTAARAVREARDVDPLDVLRAVAVADARWSMPTPALWLAIGDRVIAVDPTAPDLSREQIVVGGVGPLRSVRGATVDGEPRLLVGGRDGVAVIDPRDGRATTYAFPAAGDVGFNAACVLVASDTLLATHSTHGVVRWSLDVPDRAGERVPVDAPVGARTLTPASDDAAAFVDADGRLMFVDARGARPAAVATTRVVDAVAIGDGRLLVVDAARNVALLDANGDVAESVRVARDACAIAAIDVCGLPRAIVTSDDGGLLFVDPAGGAVTRLGEAKFPARATRARPGFAVLLGVDRMRVALLDLAQPDATPIELHVHAALGRRVADVCFA